MQPRGILFALIMGIATSAWASARVDPELIQNFTNTLNDPQMPETYKKSFADLILKLQKAHSTLEVQQTLADASHLLEEVKEAVTQVRANALLADVLDDKKKTPLASEVLKQSDAVAKGKTDTPALDSDSRAPASLPETEMTQAKAPDPALDARNEVIPEESAPIAANPLAGPTEPAPPAANSSTPIPSNFFTNASVGSPPIASAPAASSPTTPAALPASSVASAPAATPAPASSAPAAAAPSAPAATSTPSFAQKIQSLQNKVNTQIAAAPTASTGVSSGKVVAGVAAAVTAKRVTPLASAFVQRAPASFMEQLRQLGGQTREIRRSESAPVAGAQNEKPKPCKNLFGELARN